LIRIRIQESFWPWIRDGKIRIWDPQHCSKQNKKLSPSSGRRVCLSRILIRVTSSALVVISTFSMKQGMGPCKQRRKNLLRRMTTTLSWRTDIVKN
jgi:hypothetical protein